MNDLKKLGEIFAALMEERGYNINDHTPVMNGLGAYYVLNLEGVNPDLDKEVKDTISLAYDMAMVTIKKNKLH